MMSKNRVQQFSVGKAPVGYRRVFGTGYLYAFIYNRNMTILAHPVKPELVGQNQLVKKDWAGGKYFRRASLR
jgi:hypothetical protein